MTTTEDHDPVTTITDWITTMEEVCSDPDSDLEDIVLTIDTAQRIRQHLTLLESVLAAVVVERTPFGATPEDRTFPGIGTYEIRGGKTRSRFDNERIISRLAAHLADTARMPDRDTGEIPPPAVVAQRTCEWFAGAVGAGTPGFKAWRTGKLKEAGINPDDVTLESEPSGYSIIIRRATTTKGS
jgi:hypothetical protein